MGEAETPAKRAKKNSQRRRIPKFLKLPRQRAYAIDSFIDVANAWKAALDHCLFDFPDIDRAQNVFRPALIQLIPTVMAVADSSQFATAIEELMDDTVQQLEAIGTMCRKSPADTYLWQKRTGSQSTWASAKSATERTITKLKGYAPRLRPPLPLSDIERQIWDLLKDQTLSAKELVERIKPKPRDPSAIRQAIQTMRRSGWDVGRRVGVGYFRKANS